MCVIGSNQPIFLSTQVEKISVRTVKNYWMRLIETSLFVSGEKNNYLSKPKAKANNLSAIH